MGGGSRREERHSPLVVSLLESALLVLLLYKPSHGYTLISELGAFNMTTINPSVVYRTLREMEELGWVLSDWETDQTQGPPRRIYELTQPGKEALQYWKGELERTKGTIDQILRRANG